MFVCVCVLNVEERRKGSLRSFGVGFKLVDLRSSSLWEALEGIKS